MTSLRAIPPAQPLLTAAAMREAEQRWFAAGNDSFALMQAAAACVADEAARMAPTGGRILVLAGTGNNGGDGHVAAALLRQRGYRVAVAATGVGLTGDAARAAALWDGPVATDEDWGKADLLIDALFGTDLSRPLDDKAARMVARVNAAGVPVLAVDMPSGIDADSGAIMGCAVRATATISFHAAKPGHFLLPGKAHAGRLTVADIGLPPPDTRLFANGAGLWRLPRPAAGTHKYARGAALVWSGPEFMTGASRMAASAALRVGAGAVTLVGDRDALRVHAAHLTAVMLAPAEPDGFGELMAGAKIRAGCVGPGGGPQSRAAAVAALQAGRALVLDADALTAFADDAAHLARLIARHARPVVLTPHDGEFARLYPDITGSRLERAAEAARRTGATVVLKASDGCIAAPDGRAVIACNTVPWLATAGSGDVLAGMITGLMAQGMDGFEASAAASWLHGELGCRLGAGLIAEDLAGTALHALLHDLEVIADQSA